MAGVRSYWGWGVEERHTAGDALGKLAARLASTLGAKVSPRPLPSLDAIELAEPRFSPPVELRAFGTTDKRERVLHARGKSYPDQVRGFRGDFASAPDWVFSPTTEEQIALLFRFCAAESVALVPYGGGTSVVGGVEHVAQGRFRGTACVDMTRMDRVLEVDVASRAARVQAGAMGPGLAAQLAPHGLTLRHFPQSFEFSTVGGWIATRAGGHYATLHTRIDDFVEAVRMVSPAGVVETRRLPASGAGPTAEALVLGSEGALGIITEAWLRVQARPKWRSSASVMFSKLEDAVLTAQALAQSDLYPSNCRVLDPAEAMLHKVGDGGAVLLLAFESADHPVEPWMERALSIASDAGGREEEPTYTTDPVYSVRPAHLTSRPPLSQPPLSSSAPPASSRDAELAATWKEAFFEAPYLQSALVRLGAVCDTFETACTWQAFPALHAAITEAVQGAMQRVCGGGVLSMRFTHVYPDGPAPYYTFIAPGREGAEIEQWEAIKSAASEAILSAGGTITHHHAVGRTHLPWADKERSPLFGRALAAVKSELDPSGILNPGCLVRAK